MPRLREPSFEPNFVDFTSISRQKQSRKVNPQIDFYFQEFQKIE
jgi:hypothetical protein